MRAKILIRHPAAASALGLFLATFLAAGPVEPPGAADCTSASLEAQGALEDCPERTADLETVPAVQVAPAARVLAETGGDGRLILRSGAIEPPGAVSAAGATACLDSGSPVVLSFRGSPGAAQKRAVESAGWRLVTYAGDHAFIAVPTGRAGAVRGELPDLAWCADYPAERRLAPELQTAFEVGGDGRAAIAVYLFDHVDWAVVESRLRRLDIEVTAGRAGRPRSGDRAARWARLLIAVERDAWERNRGEIAGWPEVIWIDVPRRLDFDNDSSAWVGQSGIGRDLATPVHDHGLYGEGQVVGILDSGVDVDSCHFRDDAFGLPAINQGLGVGVPDPGHRKILLYTFLWDQDNPANPTDWDDFGHGTHTAGSFSGDDLASPGTRDHRDGMAPAAKLLIQDSGYLPNPPAGCSNIAAFGCPVGDLYPFYEQAYLQGARIHSNSYGDDAVIPINSYTAEGSEAADTIMWDHPELLLLFSAGNTGPSPGSVHNPATAKNVVSVGATTYGSSADSLVSFSARGPTLDGRRKPDVTAPGFGIVSAASDGSITTNNCTPAVSSGTSMACPTVAGLAALVREYYDKGFYPSGAASAPDAVAPTGALLKATLIASAAAMANEAPPPSNDQGWGRPVLDDALYFTGDATRLYVEDVHARFSEAGDLDAHTVEVLDDSQPLRVVLAWTDYPSNPIASVNLVNDLDLEVESPTGATYLGNVFAGGSSVTGGSADALNNVEAVRVESPEAGTWTVRVRAAAVPEPSQGYALVATGRLPARGVLLEHVAIGVDDGIGGNQDGVIDPGEWVDLSLTLLNGGDAIATDVALSLESLTPEVEVVEAATSLPDLDPGQAASTAAPQLRFRVRPGHVCTNPLTLRLTYAADGHAHSEELTFETGSRSVFIREDFEGLTDWQLSAGESDASRGHWGIGDPEGTGFQPEDDVTKSPGSRCLFTAPNPGGGIGTDDVDGGVTVARSRGRDLSGHPEARISVHRWFANRDVGEDPNDFFRLEIREGSAAPDEVLESLDHWQNLPQWFERTFRVADFVTPGPGIELKVSASDGFGPGSVIEAALDEITFWDPVCQVHDPAPNPVDSLALQAAGPDVELRWQPPPLDPDHGEVTLFRVYRSTSASGGFAAIGTVPGDAAPPGYTDAGGMVSEEDLYYEIVAENAAGPSDAPPE